MTDEPHVTDLAPPEAYPPRLPPDTRRVVLIEDHVIRELGPDCATVVRAYRYDCAPYGAERENFR